MASAFKLIPAEKFQAVHDGKKISLYTLHAGNVTMQVTNYGARVVSIWTPDRDGNYADVETGLGNIQEYLGDKGERFLGAAVGPVANRIGKAHFVLDGKEYKLVDNNDGNTLHGGFIGIDRLVWDVLEAAEDHLVLSVVHPDGLEGLPGNLSIKMTYSLNDKNEFRVDYEATTDAPTPVNLSHHSFFNLSGRSDKSILGYELQINASHTTAIDNLLIPTGEIASVEGSPLDFRKPHQIGERVNAKDRQIANGYGYDHNWVIDRKGEGVQFNAKVYDPECGRFIEVYSDQPGIQFYCGNFFNGKQKDKFGVPIGYRCSLALETQKWPDSINHKGFCDTVLRPGETYTHTCIYRFGAE
ncbi:MAG: galactose mutarotase [Bacteroidales bacterium]|nr:galactose mutarotase [Bacteroidales bacterium]